MISAALARRAPSPARIVLFSLIAALSATAILAPAQGEAKQRKNPRIDVMTRNVYLGADLGPAIGADSLPEAIKGAGEIYNELRSTHFPQRALLLAQEIESSKADLVGLQEVAHWRVQRPSDLGWSESGGVGEPATKTRFNFLRNLMRHLGDRYERIAVQPEFDAELPADVDGDSSTGPLGADLDARLTMRDVILRRRGSNIRVMRKKTEKGHFDTRYTANVGGAQIEAVRGWIALDAKKPRTPRTKPRRFRFVNTHLEAFGDPEIREAQARELFDANGPLRARNKQVVLVGDINSGGRKDRIGAPFTNPKDPLAYRALVRDFAMANRGARQTCCYPTIFGDQLGGYRFDHTVDHVLVRPPVRRLRSFVTGSNPSVTTKDGLLSSDHGGVVSRLKLRKP